MGDLFDRVRGAVLEGRYVFTDHADNMLRERLIMHWQIVHGLEHGRLLVERPVARPSPAVEVEQALADGTSMKAVWAHVQGIDLAEFVTVHFFDE